MTAKTAAFFSEIADDYDAFDPVSETRALDMTLMTNPYLLHNFERPSVIDLGCGTGTMMMMFFAHANIALGKKILLDSSAGMIAKAAKNFGKLEDTSAYEPWLGDIEAVERNFNKFDIVLASDLLTWMPDAGAFFATVRGMMKQHGLFVFSHEVARGTEAISVYGTSVDGDHPGVCRYRPKTPVDLLLRQNGFFDMTGQGITQHYRHPALGDDPVITNMHVALAI